MSLKNNSKVFENIEEFQQTIDEIIIEKKSKEFK